MKIDFSNKHGFHEPNIVFSVENFSCWGEGKSVVILYSDGRLLTIDNRGTRTVIATDIELAHEVESFILENSRRILLLPDSDSSGMVICDVCPHNLNFRGKKCSAYMMVQGNDEFKFFYNEVSRIIRNHGYLLNHRLIRIREEDIGLSL